MVENEYGAQARQEPFSACKDKAREKASRSEKPANLFLSKIPYNANALIKVQITNNMLSQTKKTPNRCPFCNGNIFLFYIFDFLTYIDKNLLICYTNIITLNALDKESFMKTRILAFFLVLLTVLSLVSCSIKGNDKGNNDNNGSSKDNDTYDIATNSFDVKDYDFKVYTTHNLQSGAISKSYSFDFNTQCKYSLTEYTADVKFYSLTNELLFQDSVTEKAVVNANEDIKINVDVSEIVYNDAYQMKISLSGKSTQKPEKSADSNPIVIKYLSVTFIDDDYTLLKSRMKSGQCIEENQIDSPEKTGFNFSGWYLDKQLTESAKFPLEIKSNINLYASWLKIYYIASCQNAKIKDWAGDDSYVSYNIMPTGFDYDKLEKEGYRIQIKVTYDVYYEKDYDVPLDVGYAGAPKYDAYILKSNGTGYGDSDLSTTKSSKSRTIETTLSPSTVKNEKLTLKFSTDNIQNLVHFKNIKVEFTCVK